MKIAKDKVSFKIRLAAFQAIGGAGPPLAEHPQFCYNMLSDKTR
jgi:hypothetical protein